LAQLAPFLTIGIHGFLKPQPGEGALPDGEFKPEIHAMGFYSKFYPIIILKCFLPRSSL
jgi:hypothetical protein